MKCSIFLFTFVFFTFSCTTKDNETRKIENVLPEFEMKKTDGSVISSRQLNTTPVVLSIITSWCEPCKDEIVELKKLKERFGQNVGFYIVTSESLNWGIPDSSGFTWVFGEPKLFSALKITAVPTRLLIAKGKEIFRIEGNGINENNRFLEELQKLWEGKNGK